MTLDRAQHTTEDIDVIFEQRRAAKDPFYLSEKLFRGAFEESDLSQHRLEVNKEPLHVLCCRK